MGNTRRIPPASLRARSARLDRAARAMTTPQDDEEERELAALDRAQAAMEDAWTQGDRDEEEKLERW